MKSNLWKLGIEKMFSSICKQINEKKEVWLFLFILSAWKNGGELKNEILPFLSFKKYAHYELLPANRL